MAACLQSVGNWLTSGTRGVANSMLHTNANSMLLGYVQMLTPESECYDSYPISRLTNSAVCCVLPG